MIWLLVVLWLAGCIAVGYPLARSALQEERRLFVLLSFALASGGSVQAILLVLLWRWVALETGISLAPAVCIIVGLLWWRLGRRSWSDKLAWGMSRQASAAILGMAVLFGFLGYYIFFIATQVGEIEPLFQHAGVTGWLERGLFPPTNPLEPDDPLHYRIGIYTIAAALSSRSGTLPPEGLSATLALLMPTLLFSLVAASIRTTGKPAPGIIASILGLFGGTLYPYYRLFESLLPGGTPLQATDFSESPLWMGNTLDMLHKNPSVAAGFVVFISALWLCWEAIRQQTFRLSTLAAAAGSLAWLGVVNEVYLAALLLGIGIVVGVQTLSSVWHRRPDWWLLPTKMLGCLVAAFGVNWACGGILQGVSPVGTSPGSLQLTVGAQHLGYFVHAPKALNLPTSWVPVFSPEALLDTDLAIVVLPVLIVVALRVRAAQALVALASSAAMLIAWEILYPAYSPSDSYRFGQAGMTIYLALVPLVLAAFSVSRLARSLALRRLAIVAVAILITPHVAIGAALVFAAPPHDYLARGRPDASAAIYLREAEGTYRVLVPTRDPAGGWHALYMDSHFSQMAGTILALSGDSIPMGQHVGPHDPQRYLSTYREASLTFDPAALAALKIDWVYVAPSEMNSDQRLRLREAQDRSELRLDKRFGEEGTPTERLLFRVRRGP